MIYFVDFCCRQEIIGFYILLCSIFFNLSVLLYKIYTNNSHDSQGIFFDICFFHITLVFVSSYCSFDHPFAIPIFIVIVFRKWVKIMRIVANVFIDLPVVITFFRFCIESLVFISITFFSWQNTFENEKISQYLFLPLLLFTYTIAKWFFWKEINHLCK